jgi:translation elongation factor EF-1beta
VIAKSLILWDVKGWDDTTDLDALAAKILAIELDGLVWKTEFKKEPVAYGINKLVVGCVIEDLKISTDDLSEKICEDFEDFVQSCDVAVFSKI